MLATTQQPTGQQQQPDHRWFNQMVYLLFQHLQKEDISLPQQEMFIAKKNSICTLIHYDTYTKCLPLLFKENHDMVSHTILTQPSNVPIQYPIFGCVIANMTGERFNKIIYTMKQLQESSQQLFLMESMSSNQDMNSHVFQIIQQIKQAMLEESYPQHFVDIANKFAVTGPFAKLDEKVHKLLKGIKLFIPAYMQAFQYIQEHPGSGPAVIQNFLETNIQQIAAVTGLDASKIQMGLSMGLSMVPMIHQQFNQSVAMDQQQQQQNALPSTGNGGEMSQ